MFCLIVITTSRRCIAKLILLKFYDTETMDIESRKNKFATYFYRLYLAKDLPIGCLNPRSPLVRLLSNQGSCRHVHVPANESGQATEPTF